MTHDQSAVPGDNPAPAAVPTPGPNQQTVEIARKEFASLPVAVIVLFALVAAAGVWLMTRGFAEVVAKCNGRVLAQGESCSYVSRGRRSRSTINRTYEEALQATENQMLGQGIAGVLLVLCALALIVMFVAMSRRDARSADAALAARPDAAYASRGLVGPAVAGLLGSAMVGGGALLIFVLTGDRPSVTPLALIIGLVVIALGVLVIWRSRPRGGAMMLAHPRDVTVIARGTTQTVPYSSLLFFDSTVGWENSPVRMELSDFDSQHFLEVVGPRANDAWLQTVWHRATAGETVDFGGLKLTKDAVLIGGKTLAFSDLGPVRLDQAKEGNSYVFVDQQGRELGKVDQVKVANRAVLRGALQAFGVTFP